MRPAALMLAISRALTASGAGYPATCGAAKLVDSGQFTQFLNVTRNNVTTRTTRKVLWQGAGFRVEEGQGKETIVRMYDGAKYSYMYHPAQKIAVRTPIHYASGPGMSISARMVHQTEQTKKMCMNIVRAKLGSFDCDIHELKIRGGVHQASRKIWVNRDARFPVA